MDINRNKREEEDGLTERMERRCFGESSSGHIACQKVSGSGRMTRAAGKRKRKQEETMKVMRGGGRTRGGRRHLERGEEETEKSRTSFPPGEHREVSRCSVSVALTPLNPAAVQCLWL
ncbi:hypothetical protein WMY93_032744 [Mugilogobius chulae]|uniref:Uncharacterized protein n=1 Tax=Mugilogobius chulae TaxID=88201 RepID=A0AAW0MN87_9GOBI